MPVITNSNKNTIYRGNKKVNRIYQGSNLIYPPNNYFDVTTNVRFENKTEWNISVDAINLTFNLIYNEDTIPISNITNKSISNLASNSVYRFDVDKTLCKLPLSYLPQIRISNEFEIGNYNTINTPFNCIYNYSISNWNNSIALSSSDNIEIETTAYFEKNFYETKYDWKDKLYFNAYIIFEPKEGYTLTVIITNSSGQMVSGLTLDLYDNNGALVQTQTIEQNKYIFQLDEITEAYTIIGTNGGDPTGYKNFSFSVNYGTSEVSAITNISTSSYFPYIMSRFVSPGEKIYNVYAIYPFPSEYIDSFCNFTTNQSISENTLLVGGFDPMYKEEIENILLQSNENILFGSYLTFNDANNLVSWLYSAGAIPQEYLIITEAGTQS